MQVTQLGMGKMDGKHGTDHFNVRKVLDNEITAGGKLGL